MARRSGIEVSIGSGVEVCLMKLNLDWPGG
ncbi:hypothetical protein M673_14495 [Aureimonas sp. AU20]|nr:hypothetical protein M673_14495 [Aureimonas sp. AU20]